MIWVTLLYLYPTMHKLGIPPSFEEMIKILFNNAEVAISINGIVTDPIKIERGIRQGCRIPLLEECPQHHGHKGNPGVTPGTCGAIGERAQMILVLVRALG